MEWIGQKEQEEGNCSILSHGFDSKFDIWAPQWNKENVIVNSTHLDITILYLSAFL